MTRLTVTFHSRAEAKKLIDDEFVDNTTAFISLNDTEEERKEMAFYSAGHVNRFISQVFADDEKAFTKEQASILVDLIDDAFNDSIDKFVVHCWAGISRSGAVAKFINDYYGDGSDHPILGDYRIYNKHVYALLESEFMRKHHGLTHSWE